MKVGLDADIYAYRAAAVSENDDIFIACARVDDMINKTLNELDAKDYELFLTGIGNFRYRAYPEYKAKRIGKPRPKWEVAVKTYLVDQWQAVYANGIEADDALGIAACANPERYTICSIDKDLNQIPGWHYNFVKKEKYYVTAEEGIRYFYYQLLVGDATDNIKGAPGIGPKKADGILFGLPVQDMYDAVLEHYSSEEEMDLNATCLYIWRKENDHWRNLVDAIKCKKQRAESTATRP